MNRLLTTMVVLGLGASSASADEITILPEIIALDGPHAAQRVLVERMKGTAASEDVTSDAAFSVEPAGILTVTDEGVVTPQADGVATLTATVGGRSTQRAMRVTNHGRPEPWSFRNDVLPVLTRMNCNSGACHGSAAGKNGLRLTLRGYGPEVDHDSLTRQAGGRRLDKTEPAESLLLLKPTGVLDHGGGIRFSEESLEYRILSEWIAAGCPPPLESEATVVKVEAVPRAATLQPGQTQQVLVMATYSDGRVADVTRWSRFESTNASVAKVDEEGKVSVVGHGEGAVSVLFSSLVDLAVFTAPYPDADAAAFASAPRRNTIDELNLAKLEALGIPPSPPCDDATFLRRAYLDATGALPPVDVVDSFLADTRPDKREALVDRLLESAEYVDYWAYKWSDLLLISSKKLPNPAMWAFYRFVRKAVAENTPWDTFARQIVTARGSTLANGAANYFVLHRDPIDLTESTSVAFLGLSLTCARCHNHPMEKWTQDQYYGMANLFARVNLKDGSAGAGDVIVTAASDGDVRHPRRGLVMAPQPLDAPATPIESRSDRRVTFADWLSSPENPYFDRAVINRVWANFFGRGLVDPEDDLRSTNPASDAALFDWLVDDFRAHRRDVKHLIRTIMTSAAYSRSSEPGLGDRDDGRFLSHYVVKRLPAEVLLDALGRATGVATNFAGYPGGFRSLQLPDAKIENTFLDAFGRPAREAVCSCERSDDPSVAQALHLTNGSTLNDKLRDDKGIVAKLADESVTDAEILDTLYRTALARLATPEERARLEPLLAEAVEGITELDARKSARRQAIEDLYWATLTSKEFLFNH
jgi:hypothetical protein